MKLASEVSEALPLNLESPVVPFSSTEKTCPPLAHFVSSSDLGLVCFVVLPLPPMVSQPVVMGRKQYFGMKCCSILPTLHLCLALTLSEIVTLSEF